MSLCQPICFQCTVSLPLKTSEDFTAFWCFQRVEKGFIGNEWVKMSNHLKSMLPSSRNQSIYRKINPLASTYSQDLNCIRKRWLKSDFCNIFHPFQSRTTLTKTFWWKTNPCPFLFRGIVRIWNKFFKILWKFLTLMASHWHSK